MSLCCILSLLAPILTFIYPAWQSLNAVYSEDSKAKNRWMYFWTFFGFILLVEKILVFLTWIPGWCCLKTLFIVWLWHSEYNGAQYLFHKYVVKIQPHLEDKFQKINGVLNIVKEKSD